MSEQKPRRPRSTAANGKLRQAALADAAASIVDRQQYAALPESARKAQRLLWQALMEQQTQCSDRSARRYIAEALGEVSGGK